MLFASDLDQTLIYSHRTLMNKELVELEQIRPVEWLDHQYISFMTQKALSKLKEISDKIIFVPVTTRTIIQYQRINFHEYNISHQYAVTSNGGTIFHRGVEDLNWKRHVLAGRDHCMAAHDLVEKFEEIAHPSWVIKDSGKLADGLFYYCLIDREKIPLAEVAGFKLWASDNLWELSIQGRKLYLVPINVNKKAAIQYIKENEGVKRVFAAGDSLLDLEMLKAADLAIAPAHGELFSQYAQRMKGIENIRFTQKSGIEAAEEILECVADTLTQKAVV
jgi:hydroxymethylpyrimidine pyrophosphatase-like HAD family hydrolase